MSLFSGAYNKMHMTTPMRITVFLLAVLPFSLHTRAQEVPKNDDQAPAWRFQLPIAGSSSEDTRTPADIKTEDDYFDSCCGASDPLDGPQRAGIGVSGHASFDEDFPSRFRDEIVVAHFTTWTTHLSSSRHSIYGHH
jgi:hypothetical protein